MSSRRVIVIGAGVVGCALATELGCDRDLSVLVIERGARAPDLVDSSRCRSGPCPTSPGCGRRRRWVTHAAGVAALLARQMTDTVRPGDEEAVAALRPDRFADRSDDELERSALELYRDIYATIDSI